MSEVQYVQYFSSTQLNAPQMGGATGAEGQILQVLDAALITGMCPNTAATVTLETDSILIDYGVKHGYLKFQYLNIAGATEVAFNGTHRIVGVTETTVTIAKKNITSIAGTITTKLTPLGWESIFGSTDSYKRAYRSKVAFSSKRVLYLDASPVTFTGAPSRPLKQAMVNVCDDMVELGVQINSLMSLNESSGYKDNGGYYHWYQAYTTSPKAAPSTNNSPWVIFGDGVRFYFFIGADASTDRAGYMFGDIPKLSATDQLNCAVAYSATNFTTNSEKYDDYTITAVMNANVRVPQWALEADLLGMKNLSGLQMSANLGGQTTSSSAPPTYSGQGRHPLLNPIASGIVFSDITLARKDGFYFAGVAPYLKAIASNVHDYRSSLDISVQGTHLCFSSAGYTTNYGMLAIDLMEPMPAEYI